MVKRHLQTGSSSRTDAPFEMQSISRTDCISETDPPSQTDSLSLTDPKCSLSLTDPKCSLTDPECSLTDQNCEEEPGGGSGWGGWIGIFYAGIWLIYLIQPLQDAWHLRGTARGRVGIAAMSLFAVAYLAHFLASRAAWGSRGSWRLQARPRNGRYAVLVVLSAIGTLSLGQSATASWVFVAVAGLWTWSMRVAFTVGVGIVALYELLVWHQAGWAHDQSVVLAIALAMAAVTGGMMASSRQRALSRARQENARLAVQEERGRMARDLHDVLGHSLTVITVKAELAGRLLEVDPGRARAEVADLERLSRDALVDVRRAVEGYRGLTLPGELARAREALRAAGIEADLPGSTDIVPTALREVFAWAVREGVTNVIRHSGAARCTVRLTADRVEVVDDGAGCAASSGGGHGLAGLRERAGAVGAMLMTRTVEPQGFSMAIVVGGAR